MSKEDKYPNGYVQIGNEEECFADKTVIFSIKDHFSPKCDKLTEKLMNVINEFESIGIEVDISYRYDKKKVMELIKIKTN